MLYIKFIYLLKYSNDFSRSHFLVDIFQFYFSQLIHFNYICSQIKQANMKGPKILTHKLGLWNFQHLSPTYSFFSTMAKQNLALNLLIAGTRRRLPRWLRGKEPTWQCRRHRRRGFDPWVRKIPWRRKWQPTVVFLPRKFLGQRTLVGYRPGCCKESDMCEHTHRTKGKLNIWYFSFEK